MKILSSLLLLLLPLAHAFAQQLSLTGMVYDSTEQAPLEGAYVYLTDGTKEFSETSNSKGKFQFNGLQPGTYALSVTYVGYQSYSDTIELQEDFDLGVLQITQIALNLDEVEITGKAPLATQSGDTTQYSSNAYKVNPDASAEDLIRKMPGVLFENGKAQAQGEEIRQVLVDGKPFFGDDPSAALRNLPAEVIDKIQVFDQQSEQDRFSGFNSGETTKAINIITKPGKRQGEFGKLYAGIGEEGLYRAGGNVNIFKGDARLSIIGQTNNINQQNFAGEDLSGLFGSSGSQRGRGRSRRGGGGGTDPSDFLVNTQNGIATTHAFGLNYADKWGDKVETNASYFFNQTDNTARSSIFQDFLSDRLLGQTYSEDNLADTRTINHRLNAQIEYEIDPKNTISIRPRLSLQQSEGQEQTFGQTRLQNLLLSSTDFGLQTDLNALSFSNDLNYRHRFAKRGRTVSLNVGTNYNQQDGERFLASENRFLQDSAFTENLDQFAGLNETGWTHSAGIRYSEPLGEKAQLQLGAEASQQKTDGDQETFDRAADGEFSDLNPLLSNTFETTYQTQEGSVGLRFRDKELIFNGRIVAQWAQLSGDQVFPAPEAIDRRFFNFLPRLFMRYQFSKDANLRAGYFGRTAPPSLRQLQEVIDNSNPLQLSTGNADLRQDYTHRIFARFSKTNTDKASVFYVLLSAQYTQNYIGNSTFTADRDLLIRPGIFLQRGAQLRQPVNLDGYWNARAFTTYGFPLSAIKSNLNFSVGGTFQRIPGLINDNLNYANNIGSSLNATLSSNISERVDFTLSSQTSYNRVRNSLNMALDNNFLNQSTRLGANFLIGNGWVVRSSVNHQLFDGLSEGFNQNFWLWNAEAGKKFLDDKAEISLSVFDILGQNNSISRNVTDVFIEDVQTEVLQRYVMLNFTYNIRHFGKKK